jgi:hypothetical protein
MKKLSPRVIGVNIIGTIGYMSSLLAWVLLATIALALFLNGLTVLPAQPSEIVSTQPESNSLVTGMAYVVTGVMIVVTIAVLVLLPYFIGKLSSVSLRWLLKVLHITPTKRRLFLAKSIVTTVPLIGFFVVNLLIGPSMIFSIIYIVTVVAAAFALGCFLLQLIIARALHVPERSVW